MLFGKTPPYTYAQIQQIEIYSPLDPPFVKVYLFMQALLLKP